jgi:CheY-like chemotaxis protein
MVRFAVADTGNGISDEARAHIFEPFFTTKGVNGTGLGLAIVQQIISRHDGTLRVESALGAGTTVSIDIPAADHLEAPVDEQPWNDAQAPLSQHRIVLVEDDELVAAGLSNILKRAGAEVSVVTEGARVIDTVEWFRPAGVVLDVALPDVDGITVYRELDRRFPRLPVVFSTGHADPTQFEEYLARPHVRFLQKPYEGEQLVAELTAVCG